MLRRTRVTSGKIAALNGPAELTTSSVARVDILQQVSPFSRYVKINDVTEFLFVEFGCAARDYPRSVARRLPEAADTLPASPVTSRVLPHVSLFMLAAAVPRQHRFELRQPSGRRGKPLSAPARMLSAFSFGQPGSPCCESQ
jgi:hypothetical protein